jgi:hypothetical protein
MSRFRFSDTNGAAQQTRLAADAAAYQRKVTAEAEANAITIIGDAQGYQLAALTHAAGSTDPYSAYLKATALMKCDGSVQTFQLNQGAQGGPHPVLVLPPDAINSFDRVLPRILKTTERITEMKRILLTALTGLSFASPLFAGGNYTGRTDLNSTPAQLIALYGKPQKVETGWYGFGTSYSFTLKHGVYLYATTNPYNTKVEDVIYTRPSKPWTDAEEDHLLLVNSDLHITYDGDYSSDWNGVEHVEHLGKEKNLWVKSDCYCTHQIVAKDIWGLPTAPDAEILPGLLEQGGYQLRTKKQFDVEQKFIK